VVDVDVPNLGSISVHAGIWEGAKSVKRRLFDSGLFHQLLADNPDLQGFE
jgi:hypothetical protein